ncbi:MAG TPA: nitroreductase family protein [Polyangiales bacterium]|nr:nitroreductase family protein [Polyangiales bacterium]
MDAIELLTTRASNGKLTEPAPDPETLQLAFAAAARAPDHQALRPWRVFVVRGAARDRLGELMADSVRRVNPAISAEELAKTKAKALRAPLVLVVAAVVQPHPKVPAIEQTLSAGTAAHAVLLALHARGFSAIWRTGGFAYDPEVKRAFGLRPEDAIVGFIYTGTAKQAVPNSTRPVPEAFVHEWGHEY